MSALVENMMVLRFVERNSCLSRLLSIVKVRDSDYDIKLRQFEITDEGVLIGEPFYGSEGAMTGITHAAPRPTARRAKAPSRKRR
jgi:circadian clock protein KaiC